MALFRVRPRGIRSPFQWDPWREIDEIRRVLDRIGSRRGAEADAAGFAPPVDLHDSETALLIRVDLPGVKAEDLDIAAEGRALLIRGRREPDGLAEKMLAGERPFGPFVRVIELPEEAEVRRATATLRRGVLEITVPKNPRAGQKVPVVERDEDCYLRVSR